MNVGNKESGMPLQSKDFLPFVRTYGAEHITPDRQFLRIMLNDEPFDLRLTNVGNESVPAYIAWLDTHPPDDGDHKDVDPRLPHASAAERAHLIMMMESYTGDAFTTIVTPYSSKSIPAIEETVLIVSRTLHRDLPLIILPGGKDREKVEAVSAIPPISYQNVTCKDHEEKYIGIVQNDLDALRSRNPKGKGLLFVDDVYTTGGTDRGMQTVINTILGMPDGTRHPLVVLATESAYGSPYTPPAHVFARIHLPEFIGGLPNTR